MLTTQLIPVFRSFSRMLPVTQARSRKQHRNQSKQPQKITYEVALILPFLIAAAHAQTFTTLASFNYTDGRDPASSLTQGTDSNFYGTTLNGGGGEGLVFKVTPAGALTTLHSFVGGNDGSQPSSGVIQGTDGNFYGTTANAGAGGAGTVFKITPGGALTTIHSFNVTDGYDPGRLKQGTDGNFYGTTVRGGAGGYGTVFKITPSGTLTTLHSFNVTAGENPTTSALAQGTEGSPTFYGTTTNGGAGSVGTVYKITSGGSFTLLHSFDVNDGSYPNGVIHASDGYFYGTTSQGGANGDGTVFRITSAGALATLQSFNITDGARPNSGVLQGADLNFYGTTSEGGTSGVGTIYKITSGGTLTTLYSFGGSTVVYPGGLLQGNDQNFYGTTQDGGTYGDGQVWKWTPLILPVQLPGPGIINSLAGNGTAAYWGDGGAAITAEISGPDGVAVDSYGNIYIADTPNERIRKVTASTGIISTVAGNGTCGQSGDGGPATSAELCTPTGVVVDAAGNIYIADSYYNRVRKVTKSTGTITTVAGDGTAGYSGDGGAATSAELYTPTAVALDSGGNIYIADRTNNRIRKVTVSTGIITTVAGDGLQGYSGDGGPATSAQLSGPTGAAVDAAGNIYIADFANNRIRKVTKSTGTITTVAGDGTAGYSGDGGGATSAELNFPAGVAVDSANNIYIADFHNSRIRKVTATTGVISTVAGDGTNGFSGDGGAATLAELWFPFGVALDTAGNIYVADLINNRIRAVGH